MVEQIRSILKKTIEEYSVFVNLRPVGVPKYWEMAEQERFNLIAATTQYTNFAIQRSKDFSIEVSVRPAPTQGTLTYFDYEYRDGTQGTAHINSILRKVRDKSSKYSALEVPSLYCINATSAFLWLDDDVTEADFAPLFDGEWCDAVWVLENLQVSNLGQIEGRLYINPDGSDLPILSGFKRHLRVPMYRLLGLGSDWESSCCIRPQPRFEAKNSGCFARRVLQDWKSRRIALRSFKKTPARRGRARQLHRMPATE